MTNTYTTNYDEIRHKLSNDGEIAFVASSTLCPRLGHDKLSPSILVLDSDIWIGELNLFVDFEIESLNNGFIIHGTPKFKGRSETNEMYDANQIKTLTSLDEYLNCTEDSLFQVSISLGTTIIKDLLAKKYRCLTTPSVIGGDISEFPNADLLIISELQQPDPFGRIHRPAADVK
jgi:hypothetical protein